MKTKITLLSLMTVLTCLNSALAQVGINTTDPKTTLQVEGAPLTTTTPDGIQGPTLSLAQLDAKVAAYGTDQDGAILFIDKNVEDKAAPINFLIPVALMVGAYFGVKKLKE